jgi:hypothetical protein
MDVDRGKIVSATRHSSIGGGLRRSCHRAALRANLMGYLAVPMGCQPTG